MLDTNVVSELRKPRPHPAVIEWITQIPSEQLHLSAGTIGEIQAGIEKTREQDAAKAAELEQWLDQVIQSYGILPLDAPTFRQWAKLMHRKSETTTEDAMIAATAIINGLTVVAKNTRDFQDFNVTLINPFIAGTTGFPDPRQ